jgi:putative SOS response-associated peptidase YedK
MCARITLYSTAETVAGVFHLDTLPDLAPRYNIAPTQSIAAIRADPAGPGRQLVFLRWGLIPSWATDISIGQRLLNARAESITQKPAFRSAFARRRCLIPIDGFYEWQTVAGKKQPLHFRRSDGQPFALAGLWERWQSPEGKAIESCTVLTTTANALLEPIHERMPVIVAPTDYDLWLDASRKGGPALLDLLRPAPVEELIAVPANPRVNSPRNEGPECLVVADKPAAARLLWD